MSKKKQYKESNSPKRGSLQARMAVSYFVTTALFNALFIGLVLLVLLITDVEINRKVLAIVCIAEFVIVLILCALLSPAVARKSTQPIRRIIDTAKTINHDNLSARVPMPYHKETELYELSDTINQLLDRVEQAMEREKSFASYASHEFRTPLSVLKGTMEVLIRRPRSDEEYKEKITACIKEVDKMSEMVEQLLVLTRYEDGKRSFNYEDIPVETLVNNSVAPYCDIILEKKMECRISVQPENIAIYTDEYSFGTILRNLISNAVNYGNNGGLFEVKGYLKTDNYTIEIINTGRGISEEEIEHIFDKFYRSYSSGSSDTKGFGLGLSIVKRFCTLLGIEIEIASKPDKETLVRLVIPMSSQQ